MNTNDKPIGRRNYGSIPHLPNSRMGVGDHHCHEGQAQIATTAPRDNRDEVFVQEKLDGSNVGVALVDDQIVPLGRSGYTAASSPYEQHRLFHDWAMAHEDRFRAVLRSQERVAGEWLAQAHGTRYDLAHEPFVAFDLMSESKRTPYDQFIERVAPGEFTTPHLIHRGTPISVTDALEGLGPNGYHGAVDDVEGAVWRIERDKPTGKKGDSRRVVDFLVKYVRPDKQDGKYLPELSDKPPVWLWRPNG